jgi:L-rhamnose-H+ transport protein
MPESVALSILIVLLGGVMTGSFALPLRAVKGWAWEHAWLLYSLSGLIAVPWLFALFTVPDLLGVLRAAPQQTLVTTALFGFGWGVANVLFGLAVSLAGMALGFGIVSGLSAALGSLIPLVTLTPERLGTMSGWLVLSGVALTVAGVAVLATAGRRREQTQGASGVPGAIRMGILLAVISGLLAPMLNFTFAYGKPLIEQAVRQGAEASAAVNAVWAVGLTGGFLSNAGYSIFLLSRKRGWRVYRKSRGGLYWLLAAAMGVLFTGGIFLYGRGASGLGSLGPAVGWPVYQATMILTSSGLGALTGEWRGAGRDFLRMTGIGLALLVLAIMILGAGNRAT